MILDIIVILLFLFVIYMGYKVGFLKTMLKFASGISGLIIALCLTQPITKLVVEQGWNNSIETKIYDNVMASEAFSAYTEGGKGVEGLNNLLKELGIPSFMSGFVAEGLVEKINPEEIAISISESVGYVVTTVVIFVSLLIVSALLFFILKQVVKKARKKARVIRRVDGRLGVAFYSVIFIVALYIVFFILSLVMKGLPVDNEFAIFMNEQLHLENNEFGLAKYFYENNIITNFFKLIF